MKCKYLIILDTTPGISHLGVIRLVDFQKSKHFRCDHLDIRGCPVDGKTKERVCVSSKDYLQKPNLKKIGWSNATGMCREHNGLPESLKKKFQGILYFLLCIFFMFGIEPGSKHLFCQHFYII